MSIRWITGYGKTRLCATIVVAIVIVISLYRYTNEFTSSGFTFVHNHNTGRQTLEDGYLVTHQGELDSTELLELARATGTNAVKMPRSGIAYFDKAVPHDVINKIVLELERNAGDANPHGQWFVHVKREVNATKCCGLITAAILIAVAIIRGLAFLKLSRLD